MPRVLLSGHDVAELSTISMKIYRSSGEAKDNPEVVRFLIKYYQNSEGLIKTVKDLLDLIPKIVEDGFSDAMANAFRNLFTRSLDLSEIDARNHPSLKESR